MWDLLLNEEEAMIADSVREFLARELPVERLRPNAGPVNVDRVRQEIVRLGWLGVALPESVGGSAMGLVEEILIQRECGRYLVSPGIPASVMAAHVAWHSGQPELAGKIVGGEVSATLAIEGPSAGEGRPVYAMALDRQETDLILHWNEEGMGLFASNHFSAPETRECLDDSITLQAGTLLTEAPLCWVGGDQQPLVLRLKLLLTANLVGIAGHACDLAVDYAGTREQFGKPIGAFQAVKHRCADMGVRTRLSWYQTCMAALKLQSEAADACLQVVSAQFLAAEAARENGRACIQLHGAIGFQAESDAHWFLKRALLYEQLAGTRRYQTATVVEAPRPVW